LSLSELLQLFPQFLVTYQHVPMNGQENAHDGLHGFEIAMRAKSADEACKE
jgi:hypothetical protein